MNKAKYDSLPADLKKVVDANSGAGPVGRDRPRVHRGGRHRQEDHCTGHDQRHSEGRTRELGEDRTTAGRCVDRRCVGQGRERKAALRRRQGADQQALAGPLAQFARKRGVHIVARIVGAIATSHTPTIGFAYDAKKQEDPVWKPIFDGFKPMQQWLAEKKPDVLLYIFNDHITSFFLDHYSHFALGSGRGVRAGRRGRWAAQAAADQGAPEAGRSTSASGWWPRSSTCRIFQGKDLDHGCFSPLSLLLPHEPDMALRDRAAAVSACSIRRCPAAALLQVGPGAAQGHRELSRGHQGGDRRHRRPVAPGARRALRIQQHALGHGVPRAAGEGSRRPDQGHASPSTRSWAAWKARKS